MVGVNYVNHNGDTALIVASKRDCAEVVRDLLRHDTIDMNIKGRHDNHAALLWI